jgi:hypothetical protein
MTIFLKYFDWFNTENELPLTGFKPPQRLLWLLENNIDRDWSNLIILRLVKLLYLSKNFGLFLMNTNTFYY